MGRLENPDGSTSHCRVVESSHLREQMQLHLPRQVLPACTQQIGLWQVSNSLSFSSCFGVIRKTFQERDTFDCDIFPFFIHSRDCVLQFGLKAKLKGNKPGFFFNQRFFFFFKERKRLPFTPEIK